MNTIWTAAFWKDAGERVLSTAVQALLGLIVVTGFRLDDLLNIEMWQTVGAITFVALVKVVAAGLGGNPSLISNLPPDRAEEAIVIGEQVLDGEAELVDPETLSVRDGYLHDEFDGVEDDGDAPKHLAE